MGWADSYTLRKVAREIDRKHQAGNLSLSLPLSYQFAHFLYLCTVSSQGALFFSFLFSFSVLIVIQGSSIVITHQMLSRHFIVFFSFFSFTLFPPPQSESLYHPFWCFCFFLCGPLSILLFPPSVNAVIAVRGSIGRDGEKWKKHEEGGALLLVTSWIVWGGVGWGGCVGVFGGGRLWRGLCCYGNEIFFVLGCQGNFRRTLGTATTTTLPRPQPPQPHDCRESTSRFACAALCTHTLEMHKSMCTHNFIISTSF